MPRERSGLFPYGRLSDAMAEVSTIGALESAITSGNKCINVMAGTYNLTKDLTLTKVYITGCGVVSIETGAFQWTLDDNVILDNLGFVGDTTDILQTTGQNIYIQSCYFLTTNDNYAIDLANDTSTLSIINSTFDGDSGAGRGITDKQSITGGDLYCSDCFFTSSGLAAISITGEKQSQIIGCRFLGGATGVEYHTPMGTDSDASGIISECIFDGQTSEGIKYETSGRVYNNKQIKNCNFSNQEDCINLTGNSHSTGSISILGNTVNNEPSGDFITNTLDTTIMKDNQFLQSVSGMSETAKRGTSLVHCDTSSNDVSLTLLTLARGSAGSRTVVRKTNLNNNVTISGTNADFTSFSWSANSVSFQFEWTGNYWKRQELYASEYVILNISSAQTIGNSADALVTFDVANEGQAGWNSSGVITPGIAGTYGCIAFSRWANNTTGRRVLKIQKNNLTSLQWEVTDDPGAAFFGQTVAGAYKLDASGTIRVEVYQNSGGDLDLNNCQAIVYRIS